MSGYRLIDIFFPLRYRFIGFVDTVGVKLTTIDTILLIILISLSPVSEKRLLFSINRLS